eukprot:338945_1
MTNNNLRSWQTYSVTADKRQTVNRRHVAAEKAALACLDRWLSAFNARDAKAFEDSFNFPSYRLVNNPPRMIEIDKGKYNRRYPIAWKYMINAGWNHSSWDRRTVIWSQEDKVHFDCCFSRYRKDGSLIGVYESFYIVTRDKNGHWGVKFRSTSSENKDDPLATGKPQSKL